MEQEIPPEWAAMFEGKTVTEIHDVRVPAHLSDEDAFRFKDYQLDRADEAFAREEGKPYIPRGCPTWPAADASEAQKAAYADTADALDHGYGFETGSAKQRAPSTGPLPPLKVPEGSTDVRLERQIATCVGIIEHLAHYVGRYDTEPHNCNNFMDRIVSMMNSSANVAKMVGRLRGGLQPDEKQLRQIIQHEGGQDERPPSPRSVRQ